MKLRTASIGIMFALLLSGCATMNQSECLMVDWRTIGYEDGSRGAAPEQVSKHRQACAKHGVAPDLVAYNEGRNEGLRNYCRPDNGYYVGSRGGAYRGVCPSDMEYEFVQAHRAGRELHEITASISSLDRKIAYDHNRIKTIKKDLVSKEAALISDGHTSEERIQLLAEIRNLAKEQGSLEDEVVNLQTDRARQRDRLALLRAEHRDYMSAGLSER